LTAKEIHTRGIKTIRHERNDAVSIWAKFTGCLLFMEWSDPEILKGRKESCGR